MSKIVRSLGRVAGNRWYTGNDFNEVKKPLDGDMYFHSDNSFVYQYSSQTKEWVKILEFESKIIEEYMNKKLVNYIKKSGDELIGQFKLKKYASFVNENERNILKNDFNVILGNNIDKTEIKNLEKVYIHSNKDSDIYSTGLEGQVLATDGNKLYWETIDYVSENELNTKLEEYVTLNTEQKIEGPKKFNYIELNDKIQPAVNDKSSIGNDNKHFKDGYINDLKTNNILPISRENNVPSNNIGQIGSEKYNWLKAYIRNLYANKLYENGISLEDKYLTEEDIKDIVDKTYVDQKIAELINGATEDYDTLKELEEALKDNREIMDAINAIIAKKADKVDLENHIWDKNNPHNVKIDQIEDLRGNLENLELGINTNASNISSNYAIIDNHKNTKNGNPHNVKIEEIEGLKDALDKGTTDNTATGEALKQHLEDFENPHKVSWNQVVGLENKLNDLIGDGILTIETKNGENKKTIATFKANDKNNVVATIEMPETPDIGNGVIIIQKNGEVIGDFTVNQNDNSIIDIQIPTTVEELEDSKKYVKLVGNKISEEYLPGYVDDVLEFESFTAFPLDAEKGKIYVDLATNYTYRWSGTQYIQIGGKDTAEIETEVEYLDERVTTLENNAIKKGDNITLLNNNAGYITAAEVPIPDLSEYATKEELQNEANTRNNKDIIHEDKIKALEDKIKNITGEGNGEEDLPTLDNVYTKNEIDNLLVLKEDVDNLGTLAYKNSLSKIDVGLSNVDNTSDLNKPISTATQTALNDKADKTYVDQKIANLVDSSPDTLNTLNELAAALGDDPNFATTISNNIGTKITGLSSSIDNAIVLFDGTGGKAVKNSEATIDDNGILSVNRLNLTNEAGTPALKFNRAGWNYITLPSTASNAAIGFIVGSDSTSSKTTVFAINKTSVVPGAQDNEINIGSASYHFKNLYIKGNIINDGKNYTLPSKSGTLALTSEISNANDSTIELVAGGALSGGGTFTLNQASGDTITISLDTTGVTAGTYGTAQSPSHGGTFAIPTFKVDSYGRLTSAGTVNITLPKDDNTDTKNTTGSSSTSSKIYLVGATSQSDYAQTYSDSEVYVTDGTLTTNKVQVGVGSATMQYDSTLKAIKFVFA